MMVGTRRSRRHSLENKENDKDAINEMVVESGDEKNETSKKMTDGKRERKKKEDKYESKNEGKYESKNEVHKPSETRKRKAALNVTYPLTSKGIDEHELLTRPSIRQKIVTTRTKENKSTKQSKHWWLNPTVLPVVIVLLLLLGLAIVGQAILDVDENSNGISEEPSSKTKLFKSNINQLAETFPKQTPYLWRLIGSASLDFIEIENPKRPAVILLAAGPKAHSTVDDLASKLRKCYTDVNRSFIVDGKDHRMSKKYLDDKLKSGFENDKKVAVISNFESIPAEASMIFHSYCENENSPFKRVVIIFTVHMTEDLNPKDDVKLNQKKVEQHLENQWKDAADKDHIEAMFSRVATAMAFVTPE